MANITDSDTGTLADKYSQLAVLDTAGLGTLTEAQAPTSLAMGTQPVGGSSGYPLSTQPTVQLRDGLGNNLALAGVVLTVSSISNGANGSLNGTTVTTNGAGLATFTDLKITLIATTTQSFTITFADSAGKLGTVTSASVTIVPVGSEAFTLTEAGAPGPNVQDSGTLAEATSTLISGNASIMGSDSFTLADKYSQQAITQAPNLATMSEATTLGTGTLDIVASEAYSLGEGASAVTPGTQDAYTLSDDYGTLQIDESGPDGVLSDATYALGAALAVTDSATLAEAGTVVVPVALPTDTEPITLGEKTDLSSSFSGIVVDQTGADTGALADSWYVGLTTTASDSGTLTEAGAKSVGQSTSASDSDTGRLAFEGGLLAAVSGTVEGATLGESAGLIVVNVDSDSATLVDDILTALLAVTVASDRATLTEASVADYGFTGALRGSVTIRPRFDGVGDLMPALSGSASLGD